MLRATLGSGRPRSSSSQTSPSPPTIVKKYIVSVLQTISQLACTHPIRTVAFFAIIASTTYISLLESQLFEPPASPSTAGGQLDFVTLLSGSKSLHVGSESSWKWQNGDFGDHHTEQTVEAELALLTLVFPEVSSNGVAVAPPDVSSIPLCDNSTIKYLPSSKNLLTPISQEKTLAFSVPISLAPKFVNSLHELAISKYRSNYPGDDGEADPAIAGKRWMLSAVRGDTMHHQRSFRRRVSDAWVAFVDVLKNAEELDIIIMVLGYLSMHLTFVSLFMSMRRLGSNFWLGATVLLSSTFACLFGIIVTMHFGVPLNVVLLSEGLPFLVVTIGFEKPIVLTKAVLSASLALKRPQPRIERPQKGDSDANHTATALSIQNAVQIAVKEMGYEIARDYAIEIIILVAGAASGVQGGLCQFCFLAAWILFFDCVLLFTVYTAVLTIKLEINRIKRHVALRRALEEDGVSRKVAEEVASSDEWPSAEVGNTLKSLSPPERDRSMFGVKAKDSSISKFKVLMVGGFIAINVVNFCTIPFRSGARSAGSTLSSAVTQPPIDPFKVAGNALESILTAARMGKQATVVTVLTPLKYELEYPAVHYSVPDMNNGSIFDINLANKWLESVTGSGRVVEGILKSFEDPFLSKWILAALGMSLVLNGYLFNAARWTSKDPSQLSDETADQRNGAPIPPRLARLDSATNGTPVRPLKHIDKLDPSSPRPIPGQSDGSTRTREECALMLKEKKAKYLEDEEIIDLSLRGKIPGYALEKTLEDKTRAVRIRRAVISRTPATAEVTSLLEKSELPFENYDYERVFGACCENVIGYLPLPLGVAGPLIIDGRSYFIPMATTEGVLVASASRGCKAINAAGGAVTVLTADGMTRGPCVGFRTLARAAEAKLWLDSPEGQRTMKDSFNSTSRFARLQSIKTALAGTYLYIRFKTTTGDAMGMNMISKGVEVALDVMSREAGFQDMAIISVSGNFCTDKKPAAINWIDGRGKSIVAESIIPSDVVRNVLKSDVNALVELNTSKNLIGSAMAGSIGGFNAHAANIVAAVFLATGQDPAQVVESSQCITVMKNLDGDLQISVSMPCIEVGTIGGGTFLAPQASMLDLLGVRGAHPTSPGDNARQLARIVGAAVLAGELSLCSALAAGHLVRAHMQHNRSQVPTRAPSPTPLSPTLAMTKTG